MSLIPKRPVRSRMDWQERVQAMNVSATHEMRDLYQRGLSVRDTAQRMDCPEWLVMCLIGMPPHGWWHDKDHAQVFGYDMPL